MALDKMVHVLDLAQASEEFELVVLIAKGKYYLDISDFQTALHVGLDALNLAKKQDKLSEKATALSIIGEAYQYTDQWKKAEDAFSIRQNYT